MPKGTISQVIHLSLQSSSAVEAGTKPKGYGYITPEDGGEQIFFDEKAVELYSLDDLQQGQAVEYELDPKVAMAKTVTPTGDIVSPPSPQVDLPQ